MSTVPTPEHLVVERASLRTAKLILWVQEYSGLWKATPYDDARSLGADLAEGVAHGKPYIITGGGGDPFASAQRPQSFAERQAERAKKLRQAGKVRLR